MSEIRTNLFGFRRYLVIPKSERYITERSDFGYPTKLDRFIYIKVIFIYIKRSSLVGF